FDEWNIWYRRRDGRDRGVKNKLEEPYNLRDALWTASMIHLFQRWGDKVTMANLAQMVNVFAPIMTSEKGLYLQPTSSRSSCIAGKAAARRCAPEPRG